jgi:hypothetical protein
MVPLLLGAMKTVSSAALVLSEGTRPEWVKILLRRLAEKILREHVV